jgi:hypothetical protein
MRTAREQEEEEEEEEDDGDDMLVVEGNPSPVSSLPSSPLP